MVQTKILLLILLVLIILSVLVFVIFFVNTWYCYVFEHKSWVLWKKVCKALPYAKFESYSNWDESPELENFKFYIQNPDEDGVLEVIYWVKPGHVSVHNRSGECVLSHFDRYHSAKAAEILNTLL